MIPPFATHEWTDAAVNPRYPLRIRGTAGRNGSEARVWVSGRPFADLFTRNDSAISLSLGVMAATWWHTFIVELSSPAGAMEWFERHPRGSTAWAEAERLGFPARAGRWSAPKNTGFPGREWPLPNVWIGSRIVSTAQAQNEVAPLLRIPAAVRFLHYQADHRIEWDEIGRWFSLDWLIVSPGARNPTRVEWMAEALEQSRQVGRPAYVTGLGRNCRFTPQHEAEANALGWVRRGLTEPRIWSPPASEGLEYWPKDLRVRELPT